MDISLNCEIEAPKMEDVIIEFIKTEDVNIEEEMNNTGQTVNLKTEENFSLKTDVTIKEEDCDFDNYEINEIVNPISIEPEKIIALLEDLPSDYDADTDIEYENNEDDHEEFTADPLMKSLDEPVYKPGENSFKRNVILVKDERNSMSQNLPVENEALFPTSEKNRKWAKKENSSVVCNFNTLEGPVSSYFSDCIDAADFFLRFFDDSVISHICNQSNLYAAQKFQKLSVSQQEMLTFLGINIFMGYVKLPSFKHYWCQTIDMRNDFVSNNMSRDRFTAILSNLHLWDNSEICKHKEDKLYKIEPLVTKLKEKFQTFYFPKRELCIDESVILFKGRRSGIKQCNSLTASKRGYKLWCLGDSSGYISNFEIYSGNHKEVEKCSKSVFGWGGSIILSLSNYYFGKGYILFFDDYFSSISLLEELKRKQLYACGTIKTTKTGFPKLMSDNNLQRGQFDYRSTPQGITTYKWKDVSSVYLVSNFHGIDETTIVRTFGDGTKTVVPCPKVVSDYNKYKNGIDKHDMLRNIYSVNHKSMKWWHRLFFGLMDMAIVNAYIVYCEMIELVPILEFRRMLCRGLVTKGAGLSLKNKRRKVEYSVPREVRLSNLGAHWLVFTDTRGRCEVCSKEKIASKPRSVCIACKVHLCANSSKNCFVKYHEININ